MSEIQYFLMGIGLGLNLGLGIVIILTKIFWRTK
jgi:hypothetical protein